MNIMFTFLIWKIYRLPLNIVSPMSNSKCNFLSLIGLFVLLFSFTIGAQNFEEMSFTAVVSGNNTKLALITENSPELTPSFFNRTQCITRSNKEQVILLNKRVIIANS